MQVTHLSSPERANFLARPAWPINLVRSNGRGSLMSHSTWGWAAAFAFVLCLAGLAEAQTPPPATPQPAKAAPARPQPGVLPRGPIAPAPAPQPVDVQLVLA